MSNLLEKASILTTPTAYNDGKLLSVKPVQSFGIELVTNGDFATDSNWFKDANWTIANGKATSTGSGRMFQSISFLEGNIGTTVKVSFDIVEVTSDGVKIDCYGATSEVITEVGTHSFIGTTTNSLNLYINNSGQGNLVGSIDNVSVKEVINGDFDFTRNSSATRVASNGLIEDVQILSGNLVTNGDFSQEGAELVTNGDFVTDSDWTLGTGWSIADNKAIATNSPSGEKIRQNGQLTANKTYKLVYEVTEITSGGFRAVVGAVLGNPVYSVGIYTEYITSINSDFYIRTLGTTTGSIDNVSVKEVGQDWTLGSGFSIDENKLIGINANSSTYQGVGIQANKKYKIQFTVLDYVSGNVRPLLNGAPNVDGTNVSANGTYTQYLTSTSNSNGNFSIRCENNFNGSITNISAKEITDDTDLPRIDYDGFSYQDALGSELVINGDFENGENDWDFGGDWELVNGTAEIQSSTNSFLIQSNVFDLSVKTYKLQYEVVTTNGSNFKLGGGNSAFGTITIDSATIGTKTAYLTTNGTKRNLQFYQNAFRGSIDNVSVKEYLGQEVVPDSGVGHILLEPQSTNVAIYSGNASQWTVGGNGNPNNTTRVDNQSSPDGETNASLFSRNTGTSGWFGTGNLSTTNGQTYTHSLFVKKGTSSTIIIRNVSNSPQSRVTYNIDTDTFTTENNATGNSLNYGNGWYRIEMTFEYTNATGSFSQIRHTLEDGKSMYVFGAQLEQQSYATSYIPTSGSTITRLGDVCNNSGSSDLINSTEGVLYAEIARLSDVGSCQIGLFGNSITQQVRFGFNNSSIGAELYNGAYQTLMNSTQVVTNINKIAFKYKVNDFSLWVNGVEVATDTNGSTFNADELIKLNLAGQNGTVNFYGKVKCVAVFKEALTDEELTCLTTI